MPGETRSIYFYGAGAYWGQSLVGIKEVQLYAASIAGPGIQVLFINPDTNTGVDISIVDPASTGHVWGNSISDPLIIDDSGTAAQPVAFATANLGPFDGDDSFDFSGDAYCGYGQRMEI